MARRTIFSDLDGTHIFTRKLKTDEPFEQFHDNQTRDGYYSSDLETLLAGLRETWDFRLVTARNLTSFRFVERGLGHALSYDSVALENGCVVLDRNGKIDREWYRHIEDVVGPLQDDGASSSHDTNYPLWQLKDYLDSFGFVVEWRDRIASVRLRAKDNGNVPVRVLYTILMEHYARKESEFPGIQGDYKEQSVDFFPQAAGKGAYILFEAQRQGLEIHHQADFTGIKGTVGMGNDPNDLSMLSLVEFPMTLITANRDVVAYTRARGGFIAHAPYYAGSRQMLRYVLHNLQSI